MASMCTTWPHILLAELEVVVGRSDAFVPALELVLLFRQKNEPVDDPVEDHYDLLLRKAWPFGLGRRDLLLVTLVPICQPSDASKLSPGAEARAWQL